MADLEFTGGLDLSEAIASVESLASDITTSLSSVSEGFAASLVEASTAAFAEISANAASLPISADIAPAEAEVAALVANVDSESATIAVDADTGDAQAAVDDLASSIDSAGASASGAQGKVAGFGEGVDLASGISAIASGHVSGVGEAIQSTNFASKAAIGGVAALGASIYELAQKGIEATSAEQRFNTIIGETADKVEKVHVGSLTADLGKLGIQFGSTDSDMKNTASTLFQFALNSGASRDEAAKFTDQVVALSARAVSLNPSLGNLGDVSESLGVKIARGGRFAAAYGVALTAAEINTRALSDTQKTSAGDLTIYEKATAATELAVEKYGSSLGSTVAAGAKNAANEQKSLRAELSQMLEQVGKPLVAPLFDAIRASLPDVIAIAKPLGEIGVAVLPAIAAAASLAAPPLEVIAGALQDVPTPALAAAIAIGVLAVAVHALAGAEVEGVASAGIFGTAIAALGAEVTLTSIGVSTVVPIIGAAVGGFAVGYELAKQGHDLIFGASKDLQKALDDEKKAAQQAASATGTDLPKAFANLEEKVRDAYDGFSPFEVKLRAFRDLAEQNTDKAARFALTQDHQSKAFAGMVGILNSVIAKRNADAAESQKQGDAAQALTGKVDKTSASFLAASSQYGEFVATIAASAGVTSADLGAIAQHAADLDKSTSSAFTSATSVVQKFASEGAVSSDQIIGFLNDEVAAAQQWSTDLQTLAKEGIDQGIIEQLRAAGPKAEPLIQGFLDAVASGNLQAINDAQTALEKILGDTNSTLDAMELRASIKTAERAQVTKAALEDLANGGTTSLDKLRTSSNTELAQMATDAETYLGRVGKAVTSLPTKWDISVDIAVAAKFAPGSEAAAIAALGGGDQVNPDVGNPYADIKKILDYVGHRAGGGPVEANTPYWVNENTPRSEIFVPKMAGTIYPPGSAGTAGVGGGGGVNIGQVVLQQASENPIRETMRAAAQLHRGAVVAGLL